MQKVWSLLRGKNRDTFVPNERNTNATLLTVKQKHLRWPTGGSEEQSFKQLQKQNV